MLTLFSAGVMAHSQTPSVYGGEEAPMNAITFTGVKNIPITVGNLNDYPQEYDLYVDHEPIGSTGLIGGGVHKQMTIPVRLKEPNKPQIIEICSVSVPKGNEMFRTRICTQAKLFWSK